MFEVVFADIKFAEVITTNRYWEVVGGQVTQLYTAISVDDYSTFIKYKNNIC